MGNCTSVQTFFSAQGLAGIKMASPSSHLGTCNMTRGDGKKSSPPSLPPSGSLLGWRCVLNCSLLSSAHSRLLLEVEESRILPPVAIEAPAPSDRSDTAAMTAS